MWDICPLLDHQAANVEGIMGSTKETGAVTTDKLIPYSSTAAPFYFYSSSSVVGSFTVLLSQIRLISSHISSSVLSEEGIVERVSHTVRPSDSEYMVMARGFHY